MEKTSMAAMLLALAACNSQPEVTARNATVSEVANKVADAAASGYFVRPGKWRSNVTIEDMALPGMPPQMADRMKAMMAERQPHSSDSCLTPEEAKRPKEDFFAGADKNCRYDRFDMANGKIDAEMNCTEHDATQKMVMHGTYSPDTYAMQVSMEGAARGGSPERGMNMKMRIDAKRIGECDGKTA